MTESGIDGAIAKAWAAAKTQVSDAERIDIEAEIGRTMRSCRKTVRQELAPWLKLLDEALQVDLAVHRLSSPNGIGPRKGFHIAFTHLVGRATALTVAIRQLLICGHEDAARTITRSLLETQTMALVALVDHAFANDYYIDNSMGESDFWYQTVAHGKLEARLERLMSEHGFTKSDIDELIEPIRNAKRTLSGAVHSSASSTQRSVAVPSLSKPGLLHVDPLGHISAHSPSLIDLVATQTRVFAAAILLMSDHFPQLRTALRECDSNVFSTYIASTLVLQEAEEWCDEHLAVDFDDLWTAFDVDWSTTEER